MILCRFIENADIISLFHIVDQYWPLYAQHHYSPLQWLLDLLVYYHSSPSLHHPSQYNQPPAANTNMNNAAAPMFAIPKLHLLKLLGMSL
jgi:hypothetical protein